jgi:hypothetical protein
MRIIYIGPTIRGLVRHNQIYTYRPKKVIEQAKEVSVYAGYLFIDLKKIVASKKELETEGTLLNTSYKNVQKEAEHV